VKIGVRQPIHCPPSLLIGFARFAEEVLGSPGEQLLHLLHTGYATVQASAVPALSRHVSAGPGPPPKWPRIRRTCYVVLFSQNGYCVMTTFSATSLHHISLLAPPGKYDGSICATTAMRAVADITVATCFSSNMVTGDRLSWLLA